MQNERLTRRQFVAIGSASLTAAYAAFGVRSARAETPKARLEKGVNWYNVEDWGVEGKSWDETERYFDRLPAKAKGVVRGAVWGLSRHSAGMCARFETDATQIKVSYKLLSASLGMPHMPPTGVSGLDLYAQDEKGVWRWLAVARPNAVEMKNLTLISGVDPGRRRYMLYLPLYNGVESLEIGVPAEAEFKPLPPRGEKPIVFYGTSITHGGCASRPGMAYPAIIGRHLNRPVVNLGFSGNGRMEKEVGALIAEIDAAIYVIDCLPNMTGDVVAERAEPLVRQLRKARPDTPIVLVEDRTYSNAYLIASKRKRHKAARAALKGAYQKLLASGVKNLYYLPGENQLGDDCEATVDGSHPTDLGMLRLAEALEPVLRPLL